MKEKKIAQLIRHSKLHGSDGGAGGSSPTILPDNLRSTDTFEVLLGLCEGEIGGLVDGLKSLYLSNTPIQDNAGDPNFTGISVDLHVGNEVNAQPVAFKLGGTSANTSVGVQLAYQQPQTRTLNGSQNANRIELRFNVAQLYHQHEDGSLTNCYVDLKIQYKAVTDVTWQPFVNSSIGSCTLPVQQIPDNWTDCQAQGGEWNEEMLHCVMPEPDPAPDNQTDCLARGGTWSEVSDVLRISGKTSASPYVEEIALEVPPHPDGYEVKVELVGPDNGPLQLDGNGDPIPEAGVDENHKRNLSWESAQAIVTGPTTYPGTALLRLDSGLSHQFSRIPQVWGVYQGRVVKIPNNYNPTTRVYTGTWGGVFTTGVTDNPVWILYDLIMDPTAGLARYVPDITVDIWDFYEAAQYCDEALPIRDGNGVQIGSQTQPRFTMNLGLSSQMDGHEAINHIAGAINAKVYDSGFGQIRLKIERNEDAHVMFAPENVVDGIFNYSQADASSRYNHITVSYINPDKHYQADKIIVKNQAHIDANGLIATDITAVGCQNVQEAKRRGNSILIAANTETTTVQFSVTRPSFLLEPLSTILISDPDMGWGETGRIASYDASTVTLVRPLYLENAGSYTLEVQDKTELTQVTVSASAGLNSTFTITSGSLPAGLPAKCLFSIQRNGDEGWAKPFKVLSIEEDPDNPGELFTISAIEVNRNKITDAEIGAESHQIQYAFENSVFPPAPYSVAAISDRTAMLQNPDGSLTPRIVVYWKMDPAALIDTFIVRWKAINESEWQTVSTNEHNYAIGGVEVGRKYDIQVMAQNSEGFRSKPATIDRHEVAGNSTAPDAVTNLQATIQQDRVKISWDPVYRLDVRQYEVANGQENDDWSVMDHFGATKATEIYDPTYDPDKLWYHLRVLDSSGNYSTPVKVQAIQGTDAAPVLSNLKLVNPVPGVGNEKKFPGKDIPVVVDPVTDPKYRGYHWKVYDETGTTLRYEEETANAAFTYTYDLNVTNAPGNVPERKVKIEVSLVDQTGFVSANLVSDVYENPVPAVPSIAAQTPLTDGIHIRLNPVTDTDDVVFTVWVGTATGFARNSTTLKYEGVAAQTQIEIRELTAGTDYFWIIGVTDAFSNGSYVLTSEQSGTTTDWSGVIELMDEVKVQIDNYPMNDNAEYVQHINTTFGVCTIGGNPSNHTDKASCQAAGGTWDDDPFSQVMEAAAISYNDANGVARTAAAGTLFQAMLDGDTSASAGAALFTTMRDQLAGLFVNIDQAGSTVLVKGNSFAIDTTGADVYPFTVSGSTVEMNHALINNLEADRIDTRNITVKDGAGNIIFSAGQNLDQGRVQGLAQSLTDAENNAIQAAKNYADGQFIDAVTHGNDIAGLQSQIDNQISTWFYSGVPTLNNAPANTWTTDAIKDVHLGDLYYDDDTQFAYRFKKVGSVYSWALLQDSDITQALAAASAAQDTADSKRRVFLPGANPAPPYDAGDLWDTGNGVKRCTNAKAQGQSYAAGDWSVVADVTVDEVATMIATQFPDGLQNSGITINADGTLGGAGSGQVTTTGIGAETPDGAQIRADAAEAAAIQAAKDYADGEFATQATVGALQTQVDGKIDTWFYNYAPTTGNAPANTWDAAAKTAHTDDLFYRKDTGEVWRWTGSAWTIVNDPTIATALSTAQYAQDTADNKRRVFVTTPDGPYDVGDLWDTGNGVKRCVTARDTAGYTASHWTTVADVTADEVGGLLATAFPDGVQNSNTTYDELNGTKPPTDADKTSTSVGGVPVINFPPAVQNGNQTWLEMVNSDGKIDLAKMSTVFELAAIGGAYIKNAEIERAHIQELAVDTLRIEDGAAVTGKIGNEAITQSTAGSTGQLGYQTSQTNALTLSLTLSDVDVDSIVVGIAVIKYRRFVQVHENGTDAKIGVNFHWGQRTSPATTGKHFWSDWLSVSGSGGQIEDYSYATVMFHEVAVNGTNQFILKYDFATGGDWPINPTGFIEVISAAMWAAKR